MDDVIDTGIVDDAVDVAHSYFVGYNHLRLPLHHHR
jgi:hypothetical protein